MVFYFHFLADKNKTIGTEEICGTSQIVELDNDSHRERQPKQIEVINLDDDDDDDVDSILKNTKNRFEKSWNYLDPQDQVQGPFHLESLRKWQDGGFFIEGFKVWKNGHSRDKAVLLIDLLRETEDA